METIIHAERCHRLCGDQGDSVECGEPLFRAGLCAAHHEAALLEVKAKIDHALRTLHDLRAQKSALVLAPAVEGGGRQSWHGEPCSRCKRPMARKGVLGLPPRARAAVCWGSDSEACLALALSEANRG